MLSLMKRGSFGKRDPYYKKGDYNAQCDRCDFKRKASEMKMQWNNLFVCYPECWEARNAQDFLRGFPDHQSVPIARPPQTDVFLTTGIETTIGADEATGQTTITVASSTGMTAAEKIAIILDIGTIHATTVSSVTNSTTIVIDDALTGKASSGNRVYTY